MALKNTDIEMLQNALAVLQKAQDIEYVTADDLLQLTESVVTAIERSKVYNDKQITDFKERCDRMMEGMREKIDAKLAAVKDGAPGRDGIGLRGDAGKDGKTPVAGIDYPTLSQVRAQIDEIVRTIPQYEPVEETPTELVEKINTLRDALDPNVIKGWQDLERIIRVNAVAPRGFDFRAGGGTSGALTRAQANQIYTKFHGGASNIYLSATAPDNPEYGDLWIQT